MKKDGMKIGRREEGGREKGGDGGRGQGYRVFTPATLVTSH